MKIGSNEATYAIVNERLYHSQNSLPSNVACKVRLAAATATEPSMVGETGPGGGVGEATATTLTSAEETTGDPSSD